MLRMLANFHSMDGASRSRVGATPSWHFRLFVTLALLGLGCANAAAQEKAKIGFTLSESTPHWSAPVRPRDGAPNVVIILLDDVGFGQAEAFGGLISTPALNRMAERGLRYNTFHTTSLCSPTRAALLTGRNHHAVGFGVVAEMASGFPGYSGILPESAAMLPAILRGAGYSTAAFGKWHLLPDYETSPVGPFDRWPTGRGFDYFYGFLGGETNHWHPVLYENTRRISAPEKPGYHLMSDMTDKAVDWVRTQHSLKPDQPFFLYFATGAVHSPHHAASEWIEKYRGQFDAGWDRMREQVIERQKRMGIIPADTHLTSRPAGLPAWDTLSAAEKELPARMMEAFAGYLEYADTEVGRLIDELDQLGIKDNTLIFYVVGDNGASTEGLISGSLNSAYMLNGVVESPDAASVPLEILGSEATAQNYPAAWAWAGNTPFQWMKTTTHLGGIRNGLVVDWPARIKEPGAIRSQFHHVIDIAPTIYEAAGIALPREFNGVKQQPMDGVSMLYTFNDADARDRRTTQYFEMFGNRAIYHEGWMATVYHGISPWNQGPRGPYDQDVWELYNLRKDFSQANDLAEKEPKMLRALQKKFDKEAVKYNVYPLQEASAERLDQTLRPSLMGDRQEVVFHSNRVNLPEGTAPNLKLYSHQISVDIDLGGDQSQGVLVAQGGRFGGFSLYLLGGRLYYTYNYLGKKQTTVSSPGPIPAGRSQLAVHFDYEPPGSDRAATLRLMIDGEVVARAALPNVIRGRFSLDETFDIGWDTATPVSELYQSPFESTVSIQRVRVSLDRPGVDTVLVPDDLR